MPEIAFIVLSMISSSSCHGRRLSMVRHGSGQNVTTRA
jgi:hypothetical protein